MFGRVIPSDAVVTVFGSTQEQGRAWKGAPDDGRMGRSGGTNAGRGTGAAKAGGAVMTATAELFELKAPSATALVAGKHVGSRDLPARTYAGLVALTGGPVDPALVAPAALILKAEGLVDLPAISFGSNYDLDVCSIELDRGLVDALDAGWLRVRDARVTATELVPPPLATEAVRARAQELFALSAEELTRAARHHLLRERAA